MQYPLSHCDIKWWLFIKCVRKFPTSSDQYPKPETMSAPTFLLRTVTFLYKNLWFVYVLNIIIDTQLKISKKYSFAFKSCSAAFGSFWFTKKLDDISDQHKHPSESTMFERFQGCEWKIKEQKHMVIAAVHKQIFICFLQVLLNHLKCLLVDVHDNCAQCNHNHVLWKV